MHQLMGMSMGYENYLATACIRSKPQGRAVPSGFSPNHEYAIFFGASKEANVGRLPRDEKKMERYKDNDTTGFFAWANLRATGANSWRENRPKLFYPIYVENNGNIIIPQFNWNDENKSWVPDSIPVGCKEVFPIDENGVERVWALGWKRANDEKGELLEAKRANGSWQIYRKYRPNQSGVLPGTWWGDPKYSASESGTKVLKEILGGNSDFSYPKSIFAVIDCLYACGADSNSITLDYFAGTGTTGHAVISLNREDEGNRKYILVEMGDYFDTVLKPRIQKVVYSESWKDGKPTARGTGISHCFKYLRLESYEDALANLTPKRPKELDDALGLSKSFRESYMLSYMLDTETRDSLLNVEMFEDPFNCKLHIATGTAGETKPTIVDLVETFNYLLGLTVRHMDTLRCVRVVEGENRQGERVLVLWRNVKEMDSGKLDAWFQKQKYNTQDMEFDLIYVNGDNNLENLRRQDQTWKVRLIEQEFSRLMFDTRDVI
ncbi:MAG: hypothetical protein KKA60_01645 [Proteobacteria bacterium]|nr:hypothetical protein [Pseudomonadota bacterium]